MGFQRDTRGIFDRVALVEAVVDGIGGHGVVAVAGKVRVDAGVNLRGLGVSPCSGSSEGTAHAPLTPPLLLATTVERFAPQLQPWPAPRNSVSRALRGGLLVSEQEV